MFDGLISGVLDFFGGERRNKMQMELAQDQMDFQERMSSTAHQRETKDLLAAGLNPMLSAKYGGSSTPQGAMAQVENTMGKGVSTALAAALNKATIENLAAQTANTTQQAKVGAATERNIDVDTMRKFEEVTNIGQQTRTGTAQEAELRNRMLVQNDTREQIRAQTARIYEQNTLTQIEQRRMNELVQNAIEQRELIKADVANTRMHTAVQKVNELLLRLDVPRAKNMAEAEGTEWKRNVAPFLIDAQRIGATAGSVGLRHRR